ncbi:MAG: alpha-galactosidase [Clostridia bacterium]|nr:alpha-galactosidase [Clostridia bacterium]
MSEVTFVTKTENSLKQEKIEKIKVGEISEYKVKLIFSDFISPSEYVISWETEQIDTIGFWSPRHHFDSNITPDWEKRTSVSKMTQGAPVVSLYSKSNENRMTISLSDPKTPISIMAGVIEETGKIGYEIRLFCEKVSKMSEYEITIRLDTRKIPFYKAVEETKRWWSELGFKKAYEPEHASAPLYSAWYSFHQKTIPADIIYECKIAKEYGMDTVIVDDGWQTDDNSRGYGYCGDWEVCEKKIPDMKAFVDEIHKLDMKFMLWFSVPFLGFYSKNYERFKEMCLRTRDHMNAKVLDPRFKEVREFLVDIYERFVLDYGIDGLKLDFIDSFILDEESSEEYDKMDTVSVEDAVEMLLAEISQRVKKINPEFLIEFRQSYIGPVISQYGNMFRVADCPNDPLVNRIHSLSMRMTQQGCVHSDMMMWNKNERPEALMQQLLSTMFAVPQISIRFDDISSEHKKILKWYISFWRAHKDTILKGEMEYFDVDANFTKARAIGKDEVVSVLYQGVVATPLKDKTNYIFNATGKDYIYLELNGEAKYQIFDICGGKIRDGKLNQGVVKLEIADGGMVKIN